jgi:predicted Fe-Mo cluster-binding NifX family protein
MVGRVTVKEYSNSSFERTESFGIQNADVQEIKKFTGIHTQMTSLKSKQIIVMTG